MSEKEEKIKRAKERAKRESDVFHCMSRIQSFIKEIPFKQDIFWSAINKLKEKISTEKKARQQIAEAEANLKNLKNQYGDI